MRSPPGAGDGCREQGTTASRIDSPALSQAEHAAWLPLWRGYQALYGVEIAPDVSGATWSRLLEPKEPVRGALAWYSAAAVGLVHCIQHRSCWTEGDYCYLQDLFVMPEMRGQGVGRRLIEYIYETAAREGCVRVHWLTHESTAVAMRVCDRVAERTPFVQYRRNLVADAALAPERAMRWLPALH